MFGEDLDTDVYSSIETIKTNRSRGGLFQRHKYMFILLPIVFILIIFGYFVFLRPSNKQSASVTASSPVSTGTGNPTSTQPAPHTTSKPQYPGKVAVYPEIEDKSFSRNALHLSIVSLESAAASGVMTIDFKTTEFYTEFQLDSAHETVTVNEVKVNVNTFDLATTFSSPLPEKLTIALQGTDKVNAKTATKGFLYSVSVKFDVKITDSMKGFYRSKSSSGSYILSTQFEPNYAKYAFPSFDNPAFKARFSLKITTPHELTVLGNNVIKDDNRDTNNTKMKVTVFKETPLMSTYLAAWAIGKFNSVRGATKRGLKVGIYTDRESTEELEWALECAIKAIDHYEKILGIEYALLKVDMLSIPNFEAGAMENWGLITYREVAILASKNSDIYTRIYVATVIIHELAHQWFGNLVTLKDWNNLWLNEGFASIFENVVLEDLFEDKEKHIGFFRNLTKKGLTIRALGYDGHNVVRALTPKKLDSSKINQIFDSVAYAKGGSVLYALKYLLGDSLFYKFLNKYLNKHKFDNVTFEMLRDDLKEFYNATLKSDINSVKYNELKTNDLIQALEDLVYKEGVPMITNSVSLTSSKNAKLSFTQKRYYVFNNNPNLQREYWHVAIEATFYFEDGTHTSKVFVTKAQKDFNISFEFDKSIKTVVINKTGELYSMPKYYRPNTEELKLMFNDRNIQMFRGYLNYIALWLTSRQLSIKQLKELIFYLVDEYIKIDTLKANRSVLAELVKLAEYGSSVLIGYLKMNLPEAQFKLDEVKDVIKKSFKAISTKSEVFFNKLHPLNTLGLEEQAYITSFKLNIMSSLILSGDEDTIKKYAAMFYSGNYDPNETSLVFASVVKSGKPEETYEKFIEMLKDKSTPVEKLVDIMVLLGSFDDENLMKRTLKIAFHEKEFIKNQDRIYVLAGLARNPKFTEKTLEAVRAQWTYLKELYKGSGMVGEFISLFGLSSKKETIEQLKELVGEDETVAIALSKAVERIMVNYEYHAYNKDALTIDLRSN
eukprot:GAHX01000286.1.p1 GENE.GAHX01000286.1~~GAHX01000286.1.p1  ORF type:complete len:1005 (-),score=228.81 GAHX01000286.1:16-3030(-)